MSPAQRQQAEMQQAAARVMMRQGAGKIVNIVAG